MQRVAFALALIVVFGSLELQSTNCLAQATSFEKMELAIPEGWRQLPAWAVQDLPFDANQYYEIPDDQNREQLYLKAFLSLNLRDSTLLIPNWKQYDDELSEMFEDERKVDREFYEFYERFFETPQSKRDSAMTEEGRKLIQRLQPGFDYLKLAQQKPKCFFHIAVDTAALSPHLSRDSVRKLSIRCNLNLSSPEAIESLEIGLRFERDLRQLGDMITQLTASGIEGICFDNMVMPILNNPDLETQQLVDLIRVLELHRDAKVDNDSLVQAARYEHLMFKRLFHELKTKTYLPRVHAEEIWGDEDLPLAILVMRELTQLCFYEASSDEVDEAIDKMAEQNDEIAIAAEKAKEAARVLGNPAALNSMVLAPLLLSTFQTMTQADYAREMEVLTTRYQQIDAASKLPFPESTKTLLQLQENWTTDDSWKSTRILKWFSPHKNLVSVRVRSRLRINALICLAAIRKWQLEHHGSNPVNLRAALAAAEIKVPPIDPHDGQPLKFLAGDRVQIYSVGPDGKDDQAKRSVEYWVTSPEEKGDIVFEMKPLD